MSKRALLVGINEFSRPEYNLRGCVGDIHCLESILKEHLGFSTTDIRVLVNESASSASIKSELSSLTQDVKPGDQLIFAISTHGTQVPNRNPETGDFEEDKLDEAIVPWDISYNNLILDDQLGQYFAVLPEGVHTSIIVDACHSGTPMRDFYFDFVSERPRPAILNRCIPSTAFRPPQVLQKEMKVTPYNLYSACQDLETAADVPDIDGVPRGAFSYSFYKLIGENPKITGAELRERIPGLISTVTPHKQTPQISAVDESRPWFSV